MKSFLITTLLLFLSGCTTHSVVHVPTSKVGYLITTFCNKYFIGMHIGKEQYLANFLSDKSIDEITMIESRNNNTLFPLYYSRCYVITGNATMEPNERLEYQKAMSERTKEFKEKLP